MEHERIETGRRVNKMVNLMDKTRAEVLPGMVKKNYRLDGYNAIPCIFGPGVLYRLTRAFECTIPNPTLPGLPEHSTPSESLVGRIFGILPSD